MTNSDDLPVLTCRRLAQLTGRNIQTIKNIAPHIPGGVKEENLKYWLFPKSAIEWISERKAGRRWPQKTKG